MSVLHLLAQNNYITYNKHIAKIVGVDAAVLLGELCSLECMYGDDFFCDQKRLMEDTSLSEYRIRNATRKLIDTGFVFVEKKGIPATNHYTVSEYRLLKLLEFSDYHQTSSVKFDTTGVLKIDTTGGTKFDTTINNKENNKENKKEIINNKANEKKKRYGEYGNVLLTDKQYVDLQEDFPLDYDEWIGKLDRYLEQHPKKAYKNHLLTIRTWAKKEGKYIFPEQRKKTENDYSEAEAFFDGLEV